MAREITRSEAWELLQKYNQEPFHLQHGETVEAVMGYFADKLGYGAEKDFWKLVEEHGKDENMLNYQTMAMMRNKIVGEIKVSPALVRRYVNNLPQDSIPFIQSQVEVQITSSIFSYQFLQI